MKKIFFVLLATCLISFVIAAGFYVFEVYLVSSQNNAERQTFNISKGESVNQISRRLKEAGFIKSKLMFEVYVWQRGIGSKFQVGSFEIEPGTSISAITRLLTESPTERTITIPEGWNNREIAEYLAREGIVEKEKFLAVATSSFGFQVSGFKFLEDKPTNLSLEGYLFPDTYRIYNNATIEDIILKMLENFDRKLDGNLRQVIQKRGKTIFEIITLASIIEKEVASDEDRALVSDIFWRRLEIGYPLQSDATINYITQKGLVQPSIVDTQINSPYNTYKNIGLPAGPISNPGLSAIRAAIYPKKNPYWYFLTTPDGKVIYSKTFAEHSKNKAKYLSR